MLVNILCSWQKRREKKRKEKEEGRENRGRESSQPILHCKDKRAPVLGALGKNHSVASPPGSPTGSHESVQTMVGPGRAIARHHHLKDLGTPTHALLYLLNPSLKLYKQP